MGANSNNNYNMVNNEHNSNNQQQEHQGQSVGNKREVGGAAVVGGLAGLVLAGPVVGLAAGIGAAVTATTKSKAGEVARASGSAMAAAGDRVKQWNQEHRVVEKTAGVSRKAGNKIKQWNQEHRVVEKTSNGIIRASNFVTKKLQPKNNAAEKAATSTTI